MTSLPARLPSAVLVSLAAAIVCAVGAAGSAWLDWVDRRRARRSYPTVNSLIGSTPRPGRSPSPNPKRPPTAPQ